MKGITKYIKYLWLLSFSVLAISCHSDDDERPAESWVDAIVSVTCLADKVQEPIIIIEDEPFELTYQVSPANMAAVVASHPSALYMSSLVATAATLTIVQVQTSEEGQLKLTIVPSGTEAGHGYLFALMVGDENHILKTKEITFLHKRNQAPSIKLSETAVSQALAE